MRPFKIADLKALNEIPDTDPTSWLVSAESSLDYLKVIWLNKPIERRITAREIHGITQVGSVSLPVACR